MAGGIASSSVMNMALKDDDLINKALSLSLKAHRSPEKHYLVEKISSNSSSKVIISFPGFGSVKDWYSETAFGESQISLTLFPSLKSVGNDEAALVNKLFLQRFETIIEKTTFSNAVEKAIRKKKRIIFTGHSSGATMAIFATLWALEKYLTPKNDNQFPPVCLTFGSPLIGNHILSHATRREKWSNYFTHFVMRYDILPRILLAPLFSFEQRFDPILEFFNPRSRSFGDESLAHQNVAADFFSNVMKNAANATSHAACKLMGNTNAISTTLASFIALSPYRPFGTYIFFTGSGKMIIIRNPDAVLQLLFFSAQINSEQEAPQVAYSSLKQHFIYPDELKESLAMQNVVSLDQLENLPLSSDVPHGDVAAINMSLNDLGLSQRARLCLVAAGELEKQKIINENQINMDKAQENMNNLQAYKELNLNLRVSYYEAFKKQDHQNDFHSNISRLNLASVWDGIVEKLRNYELPDDFEAKQEWIELGTQFRRLVEPLDVTNYYRHVRNNVAGPYLDGKGRPRRYKYTQRWLEHAERKPKGHYSESCLMAEVEEVWTKTEHGMPFEQLKDSVLKLEGDIKRWSDQNILSNYVLFEGSTFLKLWNRLPNQHKEGSCIRRLIEG